MPPTSAYDIRQSDIGAPMERRCIRGLMVANLSPYLASTAIARSLDRIFDAIVASNEREVWWRG